MRDFKLVLIKELKDILRDKRSFVMMFVPVLLFPLMFTLMGSQMDTKNLEANIPCIVEFENAKTEEADRALYDSLFHKACPGLIDPKEATGGRTAERELERGAVYAIIRFNDGTVFVKCNNSSTKSMQAWKNLVDKLSTVSQLSLYQTLQTQYGVNVEQLLPFRLVPEQMQTGNSTLASIAPMLLVALIMSGGVSVAVDLFTGEKERGTMESLLTTQASRISILAAKYTATLSVSLLSMLMSVLAYVISLKISKNALALMTGGTGQTDAQLSLQFDQVLRLAAVCLSLSVFAVSCMTLIGLHAKTVKEAQSQMSLLTIFPTLLGGLVLFMDSVNVGDGSVWIPIFNAIISIKMIFLGTAEPRHILFTAASSLLYAALLGVLSVRMLKSEKLLR